MDEVLNFFYVIAPCGYHTSNHKFLAAAVTAHSKDLMHSPINSVLLSYDNKRSVDQPSRLRGSGWKDVVIAVVKSQALAG